jgi:iron(III) transport system substrate-binding protein
MREIVAGNGLSHQFFGPRRVPTTSEVLFSGEAQQALVDIYALRSFHAQAKEKPGRTPMPTIKMMKPDPVAMEAQREEIKARYARIFGT